MLIFAQYLAVYQRIQTWFMEREFLQILNFPYQQFWTHRRQKKFQNPRFRYLCSACPSCGSRIDPLCPEPISTESCWKLTTLGDTGPCFCWHGTFWDNIWVDISRSYGPETKILFFTFLVCLVWFFNIFSKNIHFSIWPSRMFFFYKKKHSAGGAVPTPLTEIPS